MGRLRTSVHTFSTYAERGWRNIRCEYCEGERLLKPGEKLPFNWASHRIHERCLIEAAIGDIGPSRSFREIGAALGVSHEEARLVYLSAVKKLHITALHLADEI